jgi:hypothetical protein
LSFIVSMEDEDETFLRHRLYWQICSQAWATARHVLSSLCCYLFTKENTYHYRLIWWNYRRIKHFNWTKNQYWNNDQKQKNNSTLVLSTFETENAKTYIFSQLLLFVPWTDEQQIIRNFLFVSFRFLRHIDTV